MEGYELPSSKSQENHGLEMYPIETTGTSVALFLRFGVSFPYCFHFATKLWIVWDNFVAYGRVLGRSGQYWSVWDSIGVFGTVFERLGQYWSVSKGIRLFGRVSEH